MAVLEVKNLSIDYLTRTGTVKAVDDISFSVNQRETIGLVGESGCGKSTTGTAILKLLPPNARISGKILFKGKDLSKMSNEEIRKIRGEGISMIFQDPMTSLDPIMRIRDHFFELIRAHYPKMDEEEMRKIATDALKSVGIDGSRLDNYPFEFSGGMRQRAMIALAIALKPSILIADEPTTSLDVVVQEQILEVLRDLKKSKNMSMILITHDLGVVAELVDKVIVMYAGHLAEEGDVYSIYEKPLHPYTKALLESIPNVKLEDRELRFIPGSLPDLKNPPKGCRYWPRCPYAKDICKTKTPPTFEVDGRKVKCWLYGGEESARDENRTSVAES
ncbi:ABC transporter ATP-binding protein [Mesoaciditoga lauensis]|uniref:ABC transporter ATP-binding protein n=1 Tax=Mesoaciditoga lauensis TaxID=1495039 RepID=UPI0005693C30|nr:ABC transporter ATP-binding protein [Mesoaciditoga lauensis]